MRWLITHSNLLDNAQSVYLNMRFAMVPFLWEAANALQSTVGCIRGNESNHFILCIVIAFLGAERRDATSLTSQRVDDGGAAARLMLVPHNTVMHVNRAFEFIVVAVVVGVIVVVVVAGGVMVLLVNDFHSLTATATLESIFVFLAMFSIIFVMLL